VPVLQASSFKCHLPAAAAVAGCLEAGYADFDQIRSDPDLASLKADDRFEVGY
jgi:hypothetical protein